MSQLRTAKAGDLGAFPGSAFVVDDTPPIAQCQETEIPIANATSGIDDVILTLIGAFVGIDLAGKILTLTAPIPNVGDYNIISNTDDVLTLDSIIPAASGTNAGTVHDAAQAYLTRNQSSFIRFIESQSQAHTTKGGQLYTDLPDPPMDDACSDTFAPQ